MDFTEETDEAKFFQNYFELQSITLNKFDE